MTTTRILIADDHAILRAGLRLLLNSQPDLDVIAESGDWPDTIATVTRLQPDAIALDLSMPGGDPFEGVREIRRACAAMRVIVLTMHAQIDYFRAAVSAGAHGYVLKTSADDELLEAIREVRAGRFFASSSMAVDGPQALGDDADQSALAILSERERQVLRRAAQGMTNREIAEQVHVSVKTIESYRARMKAKLGLSTRCEIVAFAAKHGMLTPAVDSPAN